MKRTQNAVWQLSILWGALFFSIQSLNASVVDSLIAVSIPDTLSLSDSIPSRSENLPLLADSDSVSKHDDAVLHLNEARPKANSRLKRDHNPQRATILSAVLPGLGQAYNGKYWKIPIVYGLGVGLYYAYSENNRLYQYNRSQYELSSTGAETEYGTDYYKSARDYYGLWRNYSAIGIGILYIANIVDAMTDAYFKSYDISEDLSFKISPKLMNEPIMVSNGMNLSYGLSINFRLK